MLDEYNAEIDAKCPGTVKSLKNSNAYMDIRGKWNTTYKLSRYVKVIQLANCYNYKIKTFHILGKKLICGPTPTASRLLKWKPKFVQ